MYCYVVVLGQFGLVVYDLDDVDVFWDEGECYVCYWFGVWLFIMQGLGYYCVLEVLEVIDVVFVFVMGVVVGECVVVLLNLLFGLV